MISMSSSFNELKCILAGFGGQGVLFAGKVIAHAGLVEGRELSWLPSYGPEMRGGTANCSVTLSDNPIGSPLITRPNVVVAMNQPSFDKFKDSVVSGGIVILDSDLVSSASSLSDVEVCSIHAQSSAQESGLDGLSNMVLLGQLWKCTQFCKRETLDEAIKSCVPPRKAALIEKNLEAIELGTHL